MTRILMVCLGNICRSPLAEGILRSKVNSNVVFVDSAGTAGYHVGSQPDSRSIAVAKKYGIEISEQRSRKFSPIDFEEFDIIYAMDKSNFANILAQTQSDIHKRKVRLLLDEISLGINEVPDPYYGGTDGFENVFQMISKACEKVAENVSNNG